MIKLDNISVYGADNFLFPNINRMGVQELEFIKKHQLENFAQLEKMIIEKRAVPAYFIKLYELTVKYINKSRMIDRKPQIYNCSTIQNINSKDLEITEKETFVTDLILLNIIFTNYSCRVTFNDLEKLNIKSLRFFLEHVIPDGKNSLKLFPRIGDDATHKVLNALYLYEEQIKRQYNAKHPEGTNLFNLNKDIKQTIVEIELAQYIEYFLSFSYDFIWGKRSATTNKQLEKCLISEEKYTINNRKRLISILTNYMTLEELENGAIENGTLDRFMLTKSL